jgi:hypothetical protein
MSVRYLNIPISGEEIVVCTSDVSQSRKVPVEPISPFCAGSVVGLFESTDRRTAFLSSDLPWSSASG